MILLGTAGCFGPDCHEWNICFILKMFDGGDEASDDTSLGRVLMIFWPCEKYINDLVYNHCRRNV